MVLDTYIFITVPTFNNKMKQYLVKCRSIHGDYLSVIIEKIPTFLAPINLRYVYVVAPVKWRKMYYVIEK